MAARQRLHVEMMQACGVRRELQARHVRMQHHAQVRHAFQIIGIAFAEMRRQDAVALLAELEERVVGATRPERDRRAERGRPFRRIVVDEGAGFDERLRAREVGLKRFATERPARIRKPVALFEIDGVERTAIAAPMIARAAEITQASGIELDVGHTGFRAGIKRLRRRVVTGTAAFEHEHTDRRIGEGERKRDARRAAADNRKIGLNGRTRRNRAGIHERAQV